MVEDTDEEADQGALPFPSGSHSLSHEPTGSSTCCLDICEVPIPWHLSLGGFEAPSQGNVLYMT